MNRTNLYHLYTFLDLGNLIKQPPELLERLCRCGIHPEWIWRERWKQPRFSLETLPTWLQILDTVDPDDLPENPPPLERPTDIFNESWRECDDSNADLEVILKHFPAKVAERLRAEMRGTT